MYLLIFYEQNLHQILCKSAIVKFVFDRSDCLAKDIHVIQYIQNVFYMCRINKIASLTLNNLALITFY